ncbi:MAG TPA: hypothetical protein VK717_05060 [Opitutaceae bacterium]|jgi:hypothetical protein|nr:hypothetical protein [Opitutaceae bacterium]
MHATNKERSLYLCLLVAVLAGFLIGLALAGRTVGGPAGSRVHWPSPAEISR